MCAWDNWDWMKLPKLPLRGHKRTQTLVPSVELCTPPLCYHASKSYQLSMVITDSSRQRCRFRSSRRSQDRVTLTTGMSSTPATQSWRNTEWEEHTRVSGQRVSATHQLMASTLVWSSFCFIPKLHDIRKVHNLVSALESVYFNIKNIVETARLILQKWQ